MRRLCIIIVELRSRVNLSGSSLMRNLFTQYSSSSCDLEIDSWPTEQRRKKPDQISLLLFCSSVMCNNVSRSVLLLVYLTSSIDAYAVQPPSWSDPKINPCAKIANGWQHLYYPPLDRCFKIFTLGFPCPDTMELSPLESGKFVRCALCKNEHIWIRDRPQH